MKKIVKVLHQVAIKLKTPTAQLFLTKFLKMKVITANVRRIDVGDSRCVNEIFNFPKDKHKKIDTISERLGGLEHSLVEK